MTDSPFNSAIKVSDEEYYEDDFEQDTNNSHNSSDPSKEQNASNGPGIAVSPSNSDVEKGQIETENTRKEKSIDEVSDIEPDAEADAYNFTEDQRRAMMELMVQKQEDSDLLDEEPPEYNVKGRLEQLNAELANDPTPVEGDREHKVGFKPEIVDLVAPPPTFSDDESSQPNSARGETDSPANSEPVSTSASENDKSDPTYAKYNDNETINQKTFVVERDGNFEVLPLNALTASERALYVTEEDKDSKDNQNHKTKENTNSSSDNTYNNSKQNESSSNVHPRPPARPRPNTANVGVRRNVRPAHSPRPKSATYSSGSNTSLDNFSYNSPYAMTQEQKEQAKQLAKKSEEERMERERRRQEEDEMKRKENENAFRAWLHTKAEEDERKRQARDGDGRSDDSEKKEENEEAFRMWLVEKRNQGKKDKLLKKRQQQEMMEGYYVRPREDCEKAFKEWLKKKNSALRQQQEMERQRSRLCRLQVKKSKKSQAVMKAMKEAQSFRYVDYYGYRF